MIKQRKAFFIMLATLGILIASGLGLFYIYNSQLSSLNEDIAKKLAEQEVIDSQIKIYREAEDKVADLDEVAELADEVLPSSKQQGNVVAEIKKFIVDAGLEFESVTFGTSNISNGGIDLSQTQAQKDLPGVRALPATAVIKAGATYSEIQRLLQIIENNQRKMQVTEITLTPEVAGGTFSTITMQLSIYVQADTPAPAAAPKAGQ